MALQDPYGRTIDYLRLSVTDRCNLQCSYCMPQFSARRLMKRDDLLSFEEIQRLVRAAVSQGVSRIRITGGEPLIRRGIVDLCAMISAVDGVEEVAVTTNGIRLQKLARHLIKAGVQRINVSLDSLERGRFARITGCDALHDVLAGLEAAEAAGLIPIKINTVVMRGVNDDEVPALAALTRTRAYQVRFIELMPFDGPDGRKFHRHHLPVRDIMRRIPGIDRVRIGGNRRGNGPARICRLPGHVGTIGFIAPMSWHFCDNCNRLRITADGNLRSCLFSNLELNTKAALRWGAGDDQLAALFRVAVACKPRRHTLHDSMPTGGMHRRMHAIGG